VYREKGRLENTGLKFGLGVFGGVETGKISEKVVQRPRRKPQPYEKRIKN